MFRQVFQKIIEKQIFLNIFLDKTMVETNNIKKLTSNSDSPSSITFGQVFQKILKNISIGLAYAVF